ncbi:MAG: C4-type zinc ribbon domain-containing protein [Pseudomonadota bacterium]
MKDQIAILVSLQQIEIESTSVNAHLCSISKRLDLFENSRNELKQRIADETAKIEESKKLYRSHESDIKQNQVMIKRSQERLNSIKNNREYQALLKEIEELKRTNVAIEDLMIDCLNQVDDAEKKTAAMQEELELVQNDILQEQQIVGAETGAAGKRLKELDQERQKMSCKIEPDVLKLFQKVQSQQVRGNAVVPVQDAVCHGCYVNIPPQMYNELQRCDKLRMCPNCQRIIYWKQI